MTKYAYNDAGLVTSRKRLDGSEALTSLGVAYDATGRLIREGSKTYRYGYLDKVMSVTDGDTTRTFTYHADGQLASATVGGGQWYPPAEGCPRSGCTSRGAPRNTPQSESFLWDGLALIQRGDEQFMNEPHIGGGNPVASSKGMSYFNDMLGTTVGSRKDGKYSAAALTAFGESLETLQCEATSNFKHQTSNSQSFFTVRSVSQRAFIFFNGSLDKYNFNAKSIPVNTPEIYFVPVSRLVDDE